MKQHLPGDVLEGRSTVLLVRQMRNAIPAEPIFAGLVLGSAEQRRRLDIQDFLTKPYA